MSDTTTPQFTSLINDPFDPAGVSNVHQPGMLGISPDVWRSLANFGSNLATSANARTSGGFLANGPGFAGPFAAAVGESNQQGMQRGMDLSNIALRQGQARQYQLQNQVADMNMPLIKQQVAQQLYFMQHPEALQQWMQGGGFNAPTMGGGQQSQGSSNWTPTFGGGTNAPKMPKEYAPFYQEASQRTGIPIDVLTAQGAQESSFNPNATGAAGEIGLHQIKPDTAKSPGYGLQGVQDPNVLRDPRTNINFAADYLKARAGNIDWSNPQQVAQALTSYNGGGDKQYAQHVMRYMTGPQTQAANNNQSTPPQAQTASNSQPAPYQIAQAGNGPIPVPGGQTAAPQQQMSRAPWASQPQAPAPQAPAPSPQAPAPQAPAPQAQAQRQPPGTVMPDPAAMSQAEAYENAANRLEQQRAYAASMQKMFPWMPVPQPAGDPAALRQAAQQWRAYALAGATAGAQKAAQAPYNITTLRPGGIALDGNGNVVGSAPIQSNEVVGSGPNAGAHVTVLRDPRTNQIVTGGQSGGGEQSNNGLPPGSIQTALPPQQEGRLKAQGEVEADDLKHDRKIVEEDLAHVVDTTVPAKQQLMQLRGLVDDAKTGAAGPFRAEMRNWVQTFAPDFVTQMIGGNASPAQEFEKIALMGAGKQERGDLGARGGFRAIELYKNANPSMDKQPTANRDMANALLISHQFHEDYAMGATDFYNKNRSSFLSPNNPGQYNPVSQYDQQFVKTMRPELYASAIGAINGKPYSEWAKGLSNKQIQIVGGIVQRADPSAMVDIQGHQVPVAQFKTTIGPTDIGMSGNGSAG